MMPSEGFALGNLDGLLDWYVGLSEGLYDGTVEGFDDVGERLADANVVGDFVGT